MQEGLFKKDFTPLRVIQKSKLVSQPKGSFIGATPRADVLLLFPTDLYVKCHSDFSSKKNFFQPFISENLLEHDNMAYQMTCNGKKNNHYLAN